MTSAATTAGRKSTPKSAKTAKTATATATATARVGRVDRPHQRTVRPSGPAPRTPRRVSGPARPAQGRRAVPGGRVADTTPAGSLGRRAAAFVVALPDHRWLDRIVRGRAWIPVLGVMLVGIVAMQVEVLKLGANVGRSINLATVLQSRNQLLRANVARLGDDGRIERMAAKMGMVMPGPTDVDFIHAGGRSAVSRALSDIGTPDATTFLAALSAQRTAEVAADPTIASSTPTTETSGTASPATADAGTAATAATPAGTASVGTTTTTTATTAAAATTTATPTPPATTSSAAGPAVSGAVAPVTGSTPTTDPAQTPTTAASPTAATSATGGVAG